MVRSWFEKTRGITFSTVRLKQRNQSKHAIKNSKMTTSGHMGLQQSHFRNFHGWTHLKKHVPNLWVERPRPSRYFMICSREAPQVVCKEGTHIPSLSSAVGKRYEPTCEGQPNRRGTRIKNTCRCAKRIHMRDKHVLIQNHLYTVIKFKYCCEFWWNRVGFIFYGWGARSIWTPANLQAEFSTLLVIIPTGWCPLAVRLCFFSRQKLDKCCFNGLVFPGTLFRSST